MRVVNMHEAKRHLSRLVQEVVEGEPFVIARAGKPLVRVVAIETHDEGSARPTGFMAGELSVPPDFDRLGRHEIEAMFENGA